VAEEVGGTLPHLREEQWAKLETLKLTTADSVRVWQEIVKPLIEDIEQRTFWPHGRCRRCGIRNPASFLPGQKDSGHRTWCPRYVGPLRHAVHLGPHGLFHDQLTCLCGKRYSMYPDDDGQSGPRTQNECPDKELIWRGPTNDEG
jgi:hypothetical protein